MVFLCVTAHCNLQAARILSRQADSFPVSRWACFTKPKPGRERSLNAAVRTPPPFFACFRPRCRRVDQIHFCTSDDQHPSSLQPHKKKKFLFPPSLSSLSSSSEAGKGKRGGGMWGGESDPQSATAKEVGEGWVTNLTISTRIFQAQGWHVSLEHF